MLIRELDAALIERRDAACAFARETLGRNIAEREAKGGPFQAQWREDWKRCADHGLLGLFFPQEYGGAGLDLVSTVAALEGLGAGVPDNGLTLGLNAQLWAVMEVILAFGTDAQKAHYLPGLIDGSLIGADGLTEAEAGSDAMSLSTTAERIDGGYRLNGSKTFVGMAPCCDMALVYASTQPGNKSWGISAFLVDKDNPGFSRTQQQEKLGLRTLPMGGFEFRDCEIPEDCLLGSEGAGASIFQHSIMWERCLIFSSHVGALGRQLDKATAFARERAVFGGPIMSHQSVSNRLADMKVRLTTSRLMLYHGASLLAAGKATAGDAAEIKLHISEAIVASSTDAFRIHGGAGYLAGNAVERDLRDGLGGIIYAGTSDIQRQIIASML